MIEGICVCVLSFYVDSRGTSRTNPCATARLAGMPVLICNRTSPGNPCLLGTYQFPMVWYLRTLAMTGNGDLGFDTGEGA